MAAAGNGPRLPPLKLLRYGLHSIALFSVLGVLRRFDLDRASEIGAWFGRTVLAPFGRDNPHTIETLRLAYPGLDDGEVRRILTGMYENIGRIIAETAHLEQFGSSAGRQRFSFEGLEHLAAAQALDRGMILVSGHFGNWELGIAVLKHAGLDFSCITRPPNNPWVADWIAEQRRRMGANQQIPKGREGTRALFATLRRKEAVVMLIDQHLAQGIPAPLFGQDAMTTPAPATFAQKLGLAVVPFSLRRTEGAHFRVIFHPPQLFQSSGNEARDILEMTARLNRFIEDEVRLRPEHWLWMHRRFKPAEELSRRASRMVDEAAEPEA